MTSFFLECSNIQFSRVFQYNFFNFFLINFFKIVFKFILLVLLRYNIFLLFNLIIIYELKVLRIIIEIFQIVFFNLLEIYIDFFKFLFRINNFLIGLFHFTLDSFNFLLVFVKVTHKFFDSIHLIIQNLVS